MDAATKTGIDAAKTASKRVVQKTKATGDLVGIKIADKITSNMQTKRKNKQSRKKFTFPQKKDNRLLMTVNCFEQK